MKRSIRTRCIEKALKRWESFPPISIKAQMVDRYATKLMKRYYSFYNHVKAQRVAAGYE